jgi:CoA:oxalate CoA-transferase
MSTNLLPLANVIVLDFSQFLSGPSAALRLADFGARVIKVERPELGDICRTLYISNLELDGDSTLFHSINRNKESVALDLKNTHDRLAVEALIRKADVMIQNFRPGVMKKLGLDYEQVCKLNPSMVYGEITGYGTQGVWAQKPGQDLLVQSLSGLAMLQQSPASRPPTPFGLAIADMAAGAHLVQGILAALVRRSITGHGAHIEISLMESILDVQSAPLTAFMNGTGQVRSSFTGGIFATQDGYIAMDGTTLEHAVFMEKLSHVLTCPALQSLTDTDSIHRCLNDHMHTQDTSSWLNHLEEAGIPCVEVFDWNSLMQQEAYQSLEMEQDVYRMNGSRLRTTRCPIRIDGERFTSMKGSPILGQDTENIVKEMLR